MTLSIDFNLPFAEAIAAIVAKGVMLPDEFYHGIPAEAMRNAFTVSFLESIGQIADIKAKLLQHLEQGGTLASFQKWAAGQDWTLTKAHLETVYRNAIQHAYNAGHWMHFEASKGTHPYLRYSAVNDSRTRPAHRKLHGVIRPVDDPFWETHSPPLGHRCRCTLMSLTQKQADELGGVTYDVPADANADGPGWGRKPEHHGAVLKQMLEQRMAELGAKMAQELKAQLESAEESIAKSIEDAKIKSVNDAYETAKNGGRHRGFYDRFAKVRTPEIEKAARSLQKQIATHQDKIVNPMAYVESDISPQALEGLTNNYWPKEIRNFEDQLAILTGILEERTGKNEK